MNPKIYSIVERIVGLLLLIVCTLLIIQNKELKKQLELSGYTGNALVEPLEPGENATPIQCFEIDGKRSTIEYSDGYNQYLLFVFSTQCPHCEKSLPNIEKIASELVDSPVELIGVSMHGLQETQNWAINNHVNFRVITVSDSTFSQDYKIAGVPTVILVDRKGTIEKLWVGEVVGERFNEVRANLLFNKSSF